MDTVTFTIFITLMSLSVTSFTILIVKGLRYLYIAHTKKVPLSDK